MTETIRSIRSKEPTLLELMIAINNLDNRMGNVEKRLDDGGDSFKKITSDIEGLQVSFAELQATLSVTNGFLQKLTSPKFIAGFIILILLAGGGITLAAALDLNLAEPIKALKGVVQ